MGQYDCHVFVCTSGEICPTQGDTEKYVKVLRDGARQAGKQIEVRVNKAGCFSQCGHGPMIVVYPDDVWYAGVQESDLQEILTAHILGGTSGRAPSLRARRARGQQDRARTQHKRCAPAPVPDATRVRARLEARVRRRTTCPPTA